MHDSRHRIDPGPPRLRDRIPFLEPGGRLTMLSASLANAVVSACNAFLGLRGGQGIKVTLSEGGTVVELDQATKDTLDSITPPTGTGSLNWKGEWSALETYDEGDIVCRNSSTLQASSKAGTYVAIDDVDDATEPPAGETLTNTKWQTLARGHFRKLLVGDAADSANYGALTINLDASSTKLVLDKDTEAIPADLVGKTITWQRVTVCDAGTEKYMYVLGTDPFAIP